MMNRRTLIILLAACGFVSCDVLLHNPSDKHYCYSCENTSDNTVYLSCFWPNTERHYPYGFPEEFHAVAPGTTNNNLEPWPLRSLEDMFEDTTLWFYVFPSYVHEAVYLDEFKLVVYKLTLDDLIALDFKLSYPPDERMKNMEMDPPYSSFLHNE